jgi:hypothetical protein
MGIVKMRKVASRLSFKEGKPQGYQLRQLVYAPIKEKDLIKYMANSANVPESTIEACILAIADGISLMGKPLLGLILINRIRASHGSCNHPDGLSPRKRKSESVIIGINKSAQSA